MTARAQETAPTLDTIALETLEEFQPVADNWRIAGAAYANPGQRHHLEGLPGTGVLICAPTEDARDNLFTDWEHGDLRLELEVMMPEGSNSGVYLQGRYEVQLFDSWRKRNPRFSDIGGIYQRWDEERAEGHRGFHGVPPRVNASRAPGLWQHLEIDFRAPRFNDQGRKVESARFLRVVLNGVTVQENVELSGPTRAAAFDDEAPLGPLMLQGDHGPVAFRNVRYKRYGTEIVQVSAVSYRYYEGDFTTMPSLDTLTVTGRGEIEGLRHDVVANPDAFAIAYNGTVSVPTTGRYRFALNLNWIEGDPHFQGRPTGGGVLRIGDELVLRHEGDRQTGEATIRLQAGSHPFTLEYFKNRRSREPLGLLIAAGPDTRERVLNLASSLPPPEATEPVRVEVGTEVVLHRSMIDHEGVRRTHAVNVGDPEGVHYSLDLNRGSLLRVWRGPYLDAAPMWHRRGFDQVALPWGSVIHLSGEPDIAALPGDAAAWPADGGRDFGGYELNEAGRPTFHYRLDETEITDRFEPAADGGGLKRTLTASGRKEVWHRIATADRIERLPNGAFAVGDKTYYVEIDDAYEPKIRSSAGSQELIVPLRGGTVDYSIIW